MSSRSRTKSARQSSTASRLSQERTPGPSLPLPPPTPALPLPPPTILTAPAPAPNALVSSSPEALEDVPSRAMASLVVPSIDARRRLVLEDIYASLPQRKSEIDWMLRNYFERVDWAWHRASSSRDPLFRPIQRD